MKDSLAPPRSARPLRDPTCPHCPQCPDARATDRIAARAVASHPEQDGACCATASWCLTMPGRSSLTAGPSPSARPHPGNGGRLSEARTRRLRRCVHWAAPHRGRRALKQDLRDGQTDQLGQRRRPAHPPRSFDLVIHLHPQCGQQGVQVLVLHRTIFGTLFLSPDEPVRPTISRCSERTGGRACRRPGHARSGGSVRTACGPVPVAERDPIPGPVWPGLENVLR
jgi:hypothetical protein